MLINELSRILRIGKKGEVVSMAKIISMEDRRKRKPINYKQDHGPEWIYPGNSEPPDGWSGTWTRQEPYLDDSKKLYRPLSEKGLRAFPKELSDILNFKKK